MDQTTIELNEELANRLVSLLEASNRPVFEVYGLAAKIRRQYIEKKGQK